MIRAKATIEIIVIVRDRKWILRKYVFWYFCSYLATSISSIKKRRFFLTFSLSRPMMLKILEPFDGCRLTAY